MNILLVGPYSKKYISGIYRSVENLAKYLSNSNSVIFANSTSEDILEIDKVKNVFTKLIDSYRQFAEQYFVPDLIHFNSTYIYEHYRFSRFFVKHGIPYIVSPHGGMTKKAMQKKRLKKIIGNIIFFNSYIKSCEELHCLTIQEKKEVMNWKKPCFVVPNMVDENSFWDLSFKKYHENNRLNIAFIGRIDIEQKGLDILMESVLSLGNLNNFNIDLYGPSKKNDKEILIKFITCNNLSKFIHIYDAVSSYQIPKLLHNYDMFVHLSRWEGLPNSILEALACGLPCLVTPGTNMAEEISNYDCGWVVNYDKSIIANQLIKIQNEKNKLYQMSLNAKKLIREKYTPEVVIKKMEENYNRIIKKIRIKKNETNENYLFTPIL